MDLKKKKEEERAISKVTAGERGRGRDAERPLRYFLLRKTWDEEALKPKPGINLRMRRRGGGVMK